MFDMYDNALTRKMISTIEYGAASAKTSLDIIDDFVSRWWASDERALMMTGDEYYRNKTAVQKKERRLASGMTLPGRSNTRLEIAVYRKLVDQKIGYLFTQTPALSIENTVYRQALEPVLDKVFWRTVKIIEREAINKGIGWAQVYIDDSGGFRIKSIPSEQVIPLWEDNDHTEMPGIIRAYEVLAYDGQQEKTIRKVEHWQKDSVAYLVYDGNGRLVPDEDMVDETGQRVNWHFAIGGSPATWGSIPFIPFRYNDIEQPLLGLIKTLVDNLNFRLSEFADMVADLPNAYLKLKGYTGENLEDFIRDLAVAGAIKLDPDGDVDHATLRPDIAAITYVVDRTRKDLFEFGRGVDTQTDKVFPSSGRALSYLYADLDLDANSMEAEFQSSFEQLLVFINQYFLLSGVGDFAGEKVAIGLNRDMMVDESEIIKSCRESVGLISDQTILENHPWVESTVLEMERLQEQNDASASDLTGLFAKADQARIKDLKSAAKEAKADG